MSTTGLVLTREQHQKVASLAMVLHSIVMGDGKKALSFNKLSREMFLQMMDELMATLQISEAFAGGEGGEDDGVPDGLPS